MENFDGQNTQYGKRFWFDHQDQFLENIRITGIVLVWLFKGRTTFNAGHKKQEACQYWSYQSGVGLTIVRWLPMVQRREQHCWQEVTTESLSRAVVYLWSVSTGWQKMKRWILHTKAVGDPAETAVRSLIQETDPEGWRKMQHWSTVDRYAYIWELHRISVVPKAAGFHQKIAANLYWKRGAHLMGMKRSNQLVCGLFKSCWGSIMFIYCRSSILTMMKLRLPTTGRHSRKITMYLDDTLIPGDPKTRIRGLSKWSNRCWSHLALWWILVFNHFCDHQKES